MEGSLGVRLCLCPPQLQDFLHTCARSMYAGGVVRTDGKWGRTARTVAADGDGRLDFLRGVRVVAVRLPPENGEQHSSSKLRRRANKQ